MHANAATTVWTAAMIKRLQELHADAAKWTCKQIAEMISKEFDVQLTRNSIIGKSRRLSLPARDPQMHRTKSTKPRKQARVDAPIPAPVPRRSVGTGLTLIQLRDGDCKWALGEVQDYPPFMFCGAESVDGRPYCQQHCSVAYHEPRMRRE
jgi:GcrA cell cycle regulator